MDDRKFYANKHRNVAKVMAYSVSSKNSRRFLLLVLAGLLAIVLGISPKGSQALTLPLPPPGQDVVGDITYAYSEPGDNLHIFARRYDMGYDEVVRANPGIARQPLKPWTKLTLPTRFILPPGPRTGVVINLAEKRLYYYLPDQNAVATYPIAIGKEGWATPMADTEIISKVKDPTWIVPKSILEESAQKGEPLPPVVPAGPENPLGKYAFHLGIPYIRIHGTTAPFTIGTRSSHGCMRMYPEDVEMLFNHITPPVPLKIIYAPYLVGWAHGKLYLQVEAPYKDFKLPNIETIIASHEQSVSMTIDQQAQLKLLQERSGIAEPIGELKR